MYIVDFFKKLFRKENIGIIIYLVINILLYVALFGGFSQPAMAVMAIFLYLLSLCIALSPVGEFLLRLQTGCRKIKRQDYLARLTPLFQEVYQQAKVKDPSLPEDIRFFMCEDEDPNAFATGRKTVCLTKGFLTYSDEQIKATLAHEFAHLAHKDTDLLLLITVGNFLMSGLFIVYRIIVNLFVLMFSVALNMKFIGTFLTSFFINLILTFFMWAWTKLGVLLVLHSGRQAEYAADLFACELGYGNPLCAVLDSFGSASGKKGIWANLYSSHPESSDRIAKLQEYGCNYANAYGQDVRPQASVPAQHVPPQVVPAMAMQRPTTIQPQAIPVPAPPPATKPSTSAPPIPTPMQQAPTYAGVTDAKQPAPQPKQAPIKTEQPEIKNPAKRVSVQVRPSTATQTANRPQSATTSPGRRVSVQVRQPEIVSAPTADIPSAVAQSPIVEPITATAVAPIVAPTPMPTPPPATKTQYIPAPPPPAF